MEPGSWRTQCRATCHGCRAAASPHRRAAERARCTCAAACRGWGSRAATRCGRSVARGIAVIVRRSAAVQFSVPRSPGTRRCPVSSRTRSSTTRPGRRAARPRRPRAGPTPPRTQAVWRSPSEPAPGTVRVRDRAVESRSRPTLHCDSECRGSSRVSVPIRNGCLQTRHEVTDPTARGRSDLCGAHTFLRRSMWSTVRRRIFTSSHSDQLAT